MLKHKNLALQAVAHQAVSLQWLSYRLCVLSCNMLEKILFSLWSFFTQTRGMNDLLNPIWIVAAVLFDCMLASLCGRGVVSDFYWRLTSFRKYRYFFKLHCIKYFYSSEYLHHLQPSWNTGSEASWTKGLLKWLFTIRVTSPKSSPPCAWGQYPDLGFWTMFNPFLILS